MSQSEKRGRYRSLVHFPRNHPRFWFRSMISWNFIYYFGRFCKYLIPSNFSRFHLEPFYLTLWILHQTVVTSIPKDMVIVWVWSPSFHNYSPTPQASHCDSIAVFTDSSNTRDCVGTVLFSHHFVQYPALLLIYLWGRVSSAVCDFYGSRSHRGWLCHHFF